MSQVSAVGEKHPQTWDDYERGCLSTFGAGITNYAKLVPYRDGMQTVFALLRDEFPAAELCKAAPKLLAACKRGAEMLDELADEFERHHLSASMASTLAIRDVLDAAIAAAETRVQP
jgi:hypothetical protein